MFYNENITYNRTQVTYSGVVRINIFGISNPIVLNNITIIVAAKEDFSNATTVGFVTFDYVPGGIVTIESTQTQAEALISANTIYIDSASGEVSIQSV